MCVCICCHKSCEGLLDGVGTLPSFKKNFLAACNSPSRDVLSISLANSPTFVDVFDFSSPSLLAPWGTDSSEFYFLAKRLSFRCWWLTLYGTSWGLTIPGSHFAFKGACHLVDCILQINSLLSLTCKAFWTPCFNLHWIHLRKSHITQ